MQKDIRATDLYREIEALTRALRQPGSGQVTEATEVHASPDGKQAVFAGAIVDKLEGTPPTRICQIDLASGSTHVLTFGPNTDRLPKYSPDGRQVAFLSDRLFAYALLCQLGSPSNQRRLLAGLHALQYLSRPLSHC